MITRLLRWLVRLPGTAVPWVLLLAAVLILLANVPGWLLGARPVGTIEPLFVVPPLVTAYFVSLIDILGRTALSAFDEFRPALDIDDREADRLRAEFIAIPDRIALPAVVICVVGISLGYVLDPAAAATGAGAWGGDGIIEILLWLPVTALVGLVAVGVVRQLRLVRRLHAVATRVDLLEPGPIHAFSRLTAASAVGIIAVALVFALPEGGQTSLVAIEVIGALAFTGLAIASFVLPLRGLHRRLEAEKAMLINGANARLKTVQARLHQAVDTDDLSRADGLQKSQAALLAERDLYLHLSTWPWSQGTFRGFASAVVLPVLLGVALRVIGRFVES